MAFDLAAALVEVAFDQKEGRAFSASAEVVEDEHLVAFSLWED